MCSLFSLRLGETDEVLHSINCICPIRPLFIVNILVDISLFWLVKLILVFQNHKPIVFLKVTPSLTDSPPPPPSLSHPPTHSSSVLFVALQFSLLTIFQGVLDLSNTCLGEYIFYASILIL